jgi:parallel beta-helix repeat protein
MLAGTVLFALATGATAAEGRRPLFEATTISESGSYVLTNAIAVANAPAIFVDAAQATIDLNGKSISAPSASGDSLISISPNVRALTIKNGVLTGGDSIIGGGGSELVIALQGLTLSGADSCIELSAKSLALTDSRLVSYRISALVSAGSIDVRNTSIQNEPNTPNGCCCGLVLLGFNTAAVRNNTIECNAYNGSALVLNGAPPRSTAIVDGNTIFGNDSAQAITVQPGRCTISNNTVTGGHVAAITVGGDGNRVVGNRISDAGGNGPGIDVSGSSNVLADNLVKYYRIGISVGGTRNRIEGNTVVDSWEYGCGVSGSFHAISGNQIQSQYSGGTVGLKLASDSQSVIYRDNILLGNLGSNLLDEGVNNVDAGGNVH